MKDYKNKKNHDFQNKRKSLPINSKEIQIRNKKIKDEHAITKEELEEQDYKRIPEDALSVISPIIEQVPGFLAEQSIQHAAAKSFNNAVQGSFRCVLDPGLHLAERKGQSNVFLGTGLDNTTNKITAQASWLKNESVLEIPVSPQIISGIFNTLSIVTGQYFMSQINKKLSNKDRRFNNLEQRMDNKEISVLLEDYHNLQDISNRLVFIEQSPDRIISERNTISDIVRNAGSSLLYFHKQIVSAVESLDTSDNKTVFDEKLQKLHFFQSCSILSERVYLYGRILYVSLNNVYNPNEIEIILKDFDNRITENYKYMLYARKKEKETINQIKSLKRMSFREKYEIMDELNNKGLPLNTPIIPPKIKLYWNKCFEFNNSISAISNEDRIMVDDFQQSVLSMNDRTELLYLDGEWFYKRIELPSEKKDETDKKNS